MSQSETGGQRNHSDYARGSGKDRGVKRRDLKKQRAQRLAGEKCSCYPKYRAARERQRRQEAARLSRMRLMPCALQSRGGAELRRS